MGKLFGTDGVRGKANVDLTPLLAYELGLKGAYVLRNIHGDGSRAKIVVGRDTRISGEMLEAALTAGICAAGVDVISFGVIPTAGVAFLAKEMGAVAGVVISASHNPAYDNGIKFFGGNGYKLPDQVEDEIEDLILNNKDVVLATDKEIGTVKYDLDAPYRYAKYLVENIDSDLNGMKIVLDCANGASSYIAPRVFEAMGANVIAAHNKPDGWNINAACGSTHTESLQKAVVDNHAAIGLAFDGDADRLLVVDEHGNLINGDQIMVICAKYMKEHGLLKNNKLVVTVMSNLGLKQAMEKIGVEVLQTKVGDRYVIEKMRESGGIIGGEQSGHIIFSEINTTGDGLTTALFLMQILEKTGLSISELAKAMTVLPQLLKNVRVKSKIGWEENAAIKDVIAKATEKLAGQGRILVRPSGTEPLLRVMAEGPDNSLLEEVVGDIAAVVETELN
jgi:phosphoglucosamine mutase